MEAAGMSFTEDLGHFGNTERHWEEFHIATLKMMK